MQHSSRRARGLRENALLNALVKVEKCDIRSFSCSSLSKGKGHGERKAKATPDTPSDADSGRFGSAPKNLQELHAFSRKQTRCKSKQETE